MKQNKLMELTPDKWGLLVYLNEYDAVDLTMIKRFMNDIAESRLVLAENNLSVAEKLLEEIPVYLARRRAGSVIADPAKVVRTLQAAVVQGLVLWHRNGQPGAVGRYVVDHPVDPGFTGCVRVVHYQGDGFGACGDVVP